MTADLTKPRLSGWCTAPAGARPQHERCKAVVCFCFCHDVHEKED
jgi:hypothetical protein